MTLGTWSFNMNMKTSLVINSNNYEPLYYYTVEAEEGIIYPKWEVKAQR